MRGCKFGRGWPKIGDGHYPCVLALRITGAVVLFMSGGLSLGYRKGRHRGTWIAKRYSAEHRRKLLELATFLGYFLLFFLVFSERIFSRLRSTFTGFGPLCV